MITASGTTITKADKDAMHAVVDKGWITASAINKQFELQFGQFVGIPNVRTTNSGSSANLLAVAAMVAGNHWKAGDEIITAACGFPTTVNPLLLYGLVPVFVDVDIPTYNVLPEVIEAAITPKTKGIMLAHTLGNPFSHEIFDIAAKYDLKVVEDCCDALGSISNGRHVGQQGLIGTCSFFPAHHITMGEGGAVFTHSNSLIKIIECIRDWGRDCYCEPGCENTCGMRFEQKQGGLPYGYDHKYTYTQLGFNLKITEIQAALGLSQLGRINEFVRARRENFKFLHDGLQQLSEHIILPMATSQSQPSWFGFPITIRATEERQALQEYLDAAGIGSRLLFSGNITRQPYMDGRHYNVSGTLENSDKIMNDTLWLGVWPGLTTDNLEHMIAKLEAFFK